MNIAFAGFRHTHILGLYSYAKVNPNINISGAFEEHDETRRDIAERLGVEFNYNTYEELLSDESVDAVAIGDYYGIRGERVIQALNCGKHVISDKPLCVKPKEEKKIRELSEEKGLTVYLMLDLRFNSAVNTAKKLVTDGVIGKVNNIIFEGQHPLIYGSRPNWYFEDGKHGGTINDIAIHGIDLVKYITGLDVKNVNGVRTWNSFAENEPDFKDSAMFMCELSNGAGLMADVSYSAPDSLGFSLPTYWSFQIWGLKGMMHFGFNLETIDVYLNGEKEARKINPEPFDKALLDDFIDCVNENKNTVLTTEDVLNSTRSTLMIQEKAL